MMPNFEIKSLGPLGEGIAERSGKPLFIENALPGEVVEGEITEERQTYSRAELKKVLKASPDRITPPCPYFERCGGCQIMHLSYQAQLELKTNLVKEALKACKPAEIFPCTPSPKSFAYRNKMLMPADGRGKLGLYKKRSHDLIPIDHCMVHNPLGEEVFKRLQNKLKTLSLEGSELKFVQIKTAVASEEVLLTFVLKSKKELKTYSKVAQEVIEDLKCVEGALFYINSDEGNFALRGEIAHVIKESALTEHLCGLKFKISSSSFFQINPFQAENLYNKAIELAELSPPDSVLDAFCGVGGLALLSAKKCRRVTGIEIVEEAISQAKENAKLNGIENAEFICGKAEEMIEKMGKWETIFLNPPRKGCEPSLVASILKRPPKKIVYVSCNPKTLSRDLLLLQEKYVLESVHPFDLFPQTMHVETVVRLTLLESKDEF